MGNDIRSALRPALVLTILFALLLGIGYPLAMTGIGQLLFPAQANGSLVRDGDRVVGSALVGQAFTSPRYFRTRPSAAGGGYDALASAGSNLGPTSRALADRVRGDVAARRAEEGTGPVPADLVTTSASGLDPHLSPEAALFQVSRVARERGLPPAQVRGLVELFTERPLLGFIGEPRVDVLLLNRALDRVGGSAPRP